MSEAIEKQGDKKGDSRGFSRSRRCTFVLENGRKCKQKAWRGKEVCYQHDTETSALRARAGRLGSPAGVMNVREVQRLLAEALEGLRAGRIRPGEAYAVGYLAQLALTAIGEARKEAKLDVKHFWDMAELRDAIERASEMQKEREATEEAQQQGEREVAEEER